jgi:hypothetical protein
MAQRNAQGQEMTAAQLAMLAQQMNRKRKRVPIRDQNGDIIEVREVDDDEEEDDNDENELPSGMANLPQPQAAMGM